MYVFTRSLFSVRCGCFLFAYHKFPIWYIAVQHIAISLAWRHNEFDGVSYHQHLDYLLGRLSRRRSKKTSKLRITGLCEGNSLVTGEFPAQRASYAENVSIWWRHHAARKSKKQNIVQILSWENTPYPAVTRLLLEYDREISGVHFKQKQPRYIGSALLDVYIYFVNILCGFGWSHAIFLTVLWNWWVITKMSSGCDINPAFVA